MNLTAKGCVREKKCRLITVDITHPVSDEAADFRH